MRAYAVLKLKKGDAMKLMITVVLLSLLSLTASAQEVVLRDSAPGVEVGTVGWEVPTSRRNMNLSRSSI